MKEAVLKKLILTEKEKELFKREKGNFYVTDKLFYKNNILYSIKIIFKNNTLIYQLKEKNKIITESKNIKTIENKIIKILEK